jgi:membrane fusion protein, macrolide-specific efflux system
VTVTPNGSTTPIFGTVSSVGLIASSTSGVTSYPVTIDVTGAQPTLHPGASASVSIIVKQLTDVLAVPSAAIHYTGTTPKVTLVKGGSKVETTVAVGTASGLETQITKGLKAGDTVVVPVTRVGGGAGRTRTGTGGGFGGGTGGFGGGTGGFGGGTGGFGGGTGGTGGFTRGLGG